MPHLPGTKVLAGLRSTPIFGDEMLHVIHKCHMRLPDVTSRLSPLGRRRPFLLHSSPQHVAGVEGMTWLKYVEIIGKKKHKKT